jgi:hypothetical protein
MGTQYPAQSETGDSLSDASAIPKEGKNVRDVHDGEVVRAQTANSPIREFCKLGGWPWRNALGNLFGRWRLPSAGAQPRAVRVIAYNFGEEDTQLIRVIRASCGFKRLLVLELERVCEHGTR